MVELTAHAGHFLGRARNYLVAFESSAGAYLRAVGSWDSMPWYVRFAYAYEGAAAQRALWCLDSADHSMLRQFARAAARRQCARGETPKVAPELSAAG
jgi:hypothetical protein